MKRTNRGKFYGSIYLKYLFGFAERRENRTNGLGYKMISKKYIKNDVLEHEGGAQAKVHIKDKRWCIPHSTLSIQDEAKLSIELSDLLNDLVAKK